jgi:hypothetical protein
MATNTNLGTKTHMKTTKETNPFGVIHFNLHSKLYKAGKYAQAQFNLYISCRSNVPAWVTGRIAAARGRRAEQG